MARQIYSRSLSESGRNRAPMRLGLGGLLALIALGAAACSDNPNSTFLEPPGGSGGVTALLQFQGVSGPPYPVAKITPNLRAASSCSGFGAIVLAGSFNGFSLSAPEYFMNQINDCIWLVEAQMDSGQISMKFVTGYTAASVAFDNPDDYAKSGLGGQEQPLSGTLDLGTDGLGNDLTVRLPQPGLWTFVLDESESPATYRITAETLVPSSDPATGRFALEDLGVGTYRMRITAPGFLAKTLDVVVPKGRMLDLGTIVLESPSGSLSGTVAFADGPDPLPTATVEVREAGTTVPLQSTETTGAFSFAGLATGTYDIAVNAAGYVEAVLEDVAYVNGQNKGVGTITLQPGCASEFNTIQIAGELTSWTLAQAPFMTKLPNCVWRDTLTVQPGTYLFKFVTDGAFDNPKDYGGKESETLSLPGTHPVEAVSGTGTALKVSVVAGGQYVFELNETSLQFSATLLGQNPTGSIRGTVEFAGLSAAPYPRATVKLFQEGSPNPVTQLQSDATTRAFRFQSLPNGTYSVEVGSPCFAPQTRTGLVVAGSEIVLTPIALPAGTSAFTKIQLAGTLTSWDLGQAPLMTQAPSCVWTDTVTVTVPGTNYFKFVTEGAFDNPPDYGGNEAQTLTLPGTYPVIQVSSGSGTAIKADVAEAGDYIITLDERRQVFTAVKR